MCVWRLEIWLRLLRTALQLLIAHLRYKKKYIQIDSELNCIVFNFARAHFQSYLVHGDTSYSSPSCASSRGCTHTCTVLTMCSVSIIRSHRRLVSIETFQRLLVWVVNLVPFVEYGRFIGVYLLLPSAVINGTSLCAGFLMISLASDDTHHGCVHPIKNRLSYLVRQRPRTLLRPVRRDTLHRCLNDRLRCRNVGT